MSTTTTNADLCAKWGLEAREVEVKGRGVFPAKVIPAGELVVKFEGPVYNKLTCPDFSEAIQVRARARSAEREARGVT